MKRTAMMAGAIVVTTFLTLALAQEQPELAAIWKIKDEGLNRSQVMEVLSYLTDVYGPRLTGSPNIRQAQSYAQNKFREWGLENIHTERFEFGQGWTLKKFSAHMLEPSYSPLIGYPKAWTPGTNGVIRGEAIRVDLSTEADLEKYRGKLKGLFVLSSPPRDLAPHFSPEGRRFDDEQLLGLARMPDPGRSGDQSRGPRRSGGSNNRQLTLQITRFLAGEGVAAVLEPGRGDGGTVFVGSGGERSQDAAPVPPQVTLAAEHYNRICRILEKKMKVQLEIEIQADFLTQDLDDYNVLAEIPGTDRKDELVMLGAHFDSWHSGTGATDNAAGSAVAMEAIRIIKAAGLQPRRTIRIGLWSGEEQGLLGSKAYVTQHFASRPDPPAGLDRHSEEYRKLTQAPPTLKPDHAKFAGYWNLDNGTGKIRGIYLQGNEEARPIFEAWLAPFKDMGVTTLSIRNTGGTDHLSFDRVGLPGFQFIQDEIEYHSRTHHSNMDVYDRIQRGDMMQAAVVMASLVYQTAIREEKLPRKPMNRPPAQPASGNSN